MNFLNKLIRKTIGWIILIVGALGWLIPIPLVPFFLLFFVGIHILEYDLKLLRLLEKLGIDTEKAEKYLKKASLSKSKKTKNPESNEKDSVNLENQNTQDPQ